MVFLGHPAEDEDEDEHAEPTMSDSEDHSSDSSGEEVRSHTQPSIKNVYDELVFVLRGPCRMATATQVPNTSLVSCKHCPCVTCVRE